MRRILYVLTIFSLVYSTIAPVTAAAGTMRPPTDDRRPTANELAFDWQDVGTQKSRTARKPRNARP